MKKNVKRIRTIPTARTVSAVNVSQLLGMTAVPKPFGLILLQRHAKSVLTKAPFINIPGRKQPAVNSTALAEANVRKPFPEKILKSAYPVSVKVSPRILNAPNKAGLMKSAK